jgi:hypothetical protein
MPEREMNFEMWEMKKPRWARGFSCPMPNE